MSSAFSATISPSSFTAFLCPGFGALAIDELRHPVLFPEILQSMLLGKVVAPGPNLVNDVQPDPIPGDIKAAHDSADIAYDFAAHDH